MRKMKISYSGPLSFSMLFLVLMMFTQTTHAQAPAAGTSVTKAVDAGNGVVIPQGAAAAVTLVNSGSGWTTQLVSVTINGQPVAVASSSASVTSAAQSAASNAVSSVGSMLGGFGHHVSAPTGVTAVAMGQRVVLPPGATLTFVLSQPPALNAAAPTSPAAPSAPAAQPMATSATPAPSPAAAATAQSSSAQPATFFISCSTSEDGGIDTYYTGVFQIGTAHRNPRGYWESASSQSVLDHFYVYLTQKGYKFKPGSDSACDIMPTEAEAKAAQHKRESYQGGCSSCGKVVETGWKDTQ